MEFKKRIIPLVKKCRMCGKERVKNHHFFCDECYSKRQKQKNRLKSYKLLNNKLYKQKKSNDFGGKP